MGAGRVVWEQQYSRKIGWEVGRVGRVRHFSRGRVGVTVGRLISWVGNSQSAKGKSEGGQTATSLTKPTPFHHSVLTSVLSSAMQPLFGRQNPLISCLCSKLVHA